MVLGGEWVRGGWGGDKSMEEVGKGMHDVGMEWIRGVGGKAKAKEETFG